MYIYSSISLSNLSPYSLVVFVTLMKLRLAVVFGVHYLIRIPSLCRITHKSYKQEPSEYYKAWKMLRWFDVKLCQECSLRYARNSRIRKLASRVFVKFWFQVKKIIWNYTYLYKYKNNYNNNCIWIGVILLIYTSIRINIFE